MMRDRVNLFGGCREDPLTPVPLPKGRGELCPERAAPPGGEAAGAEGVPLPLGRGTG